MKELEKECQGNCPNCNSTNLEYKSFNNEGEYGYYPFYCEDCNSDGKEYYNLIYDVSFTRVSGREIKTKIKE